ncbi:MAG: hypothetical protein ACHQYP_05930 [Nitrospiria bacterium]
MFEKIDDHLSFDRENHLFRIDDRPVPSFTQCMAVAGLVNYDYVSDYYKERGSAVHRATHYYEENNLLPDYLDSAQTGFLNAWDLCLREHNCEWIEIEKPVYSIPLQIAGIPDRNGYWEEESAVCEIKTGELYPATGIQLAFQQELIEPRPKRRIAVRLYENGRYEWKEYKDRDDWKVAKACLTVTHYKRRINGSIIGS